MEVDNHTTHIHIPSVEEIHENIEKEQEKSIKQIVKDIIGPDMH